MTSRSEDKKDPGGGEGAAGVRRMHKQCRWERPAMHKIKQAKGAGNTRYWGNA
jgi:hypothetical protein